jgi:hypothetical protein
MPGADRARGSSKAHLRDDLHAGLDGLGSYVPKRLIREPGTQYGPSDEQKLDDGLALGSRATGAGAAFRASAGRAERTDRARPRRPS